MTGSGSKSVPSKSNNKGIHLFTNLVNLLLYLLYLAVVCIITFGPSSTGNYYLTKVLHYLFIDVPFKGYGGHRTTFRESSNIDDFWAFVKNVVLPNFYQTLNTYQIPLFDDAVIESKTGLEHENLLIGRARLRQIRVVPDTCPAATLAPLLSRICFPSYSSDHEDKRTINLNGIPGGEYLRDNRLFASKYWGALDMYDGAGYTVTLSDDKSATQDILTQLKNHVWITRATRVVFLEFSLFNPNINVFSSVRLAWEIPVSGGVTTSWDIATAKLTQYSTVFEKVIFGCEIAFIVFTVYFIIDEIIHCVSKGCKNYLKSGWTYISLLIFLASGSCIAFGLYRHFTLNIVVSDLSKTVGTYVNIYHLVYWEAWYKIGSASLILLVWIKLFKYLSFNRSMSIIAETLSKSAKEVGGFVFIFVIVLFAFAELGHVLFGTTLKNYSSLQMSIFALWRFVLGDVNYTEIKNANRLLGPVYFLSFIVSVFMILAHVFLAIINESYNFAKLHEMDEDRESLNIVKGCVACLTCACCKCRKGKGGKNKNKNLKTPNNQNKYDTFQDMTDIRIDPADIRHYLTLKHVPDVDIEMFMERFNILENDAMDGNDAHQLLRDITNNTYIARTEIYEPIRKRYPDEKPLPPVTNSEDKKNLEKAEMELLFERLNLIESAVVDLVPKIETFLTKIDQKIAGKKNAAKENEQGSKKQDDQKNIPKAQSLK